MKHEGYVTHLLLINAMDNLRFEDAQTIVDTYRCRLESQSVNQRLLLPSRFFRSKHCFMEDGVSILKNKGIYRKHKALREQAIALYRQRATLLSSQEEKHST